MSEAQRCVGLANERYELCENNARKHFSSKIPCSDSAASVTMEMSAWDEALNAHTHQLIDILLENEAEAAVLLPIRRLRRFVEATQNRRQASTVLQVTIQLVLNPSLIKYYPLDNAQAVTSDLVEILCE